MHQPSLCQQKSNTIPVVLKYLEIYEYRNFPFFDAFLLPLLFQVSHHFGDRPGLSDRAFGVVGKITVEYFGN